MQLLHDDCLELMKDIPDGSVDLVLTDPPYGINYQSRRGKQKYDKIKNDECLNFLSTYFQECSRVMKNDTAIYCFCSWHNIDKFKIEFEKYFKLKNVLVWEKNNHGSGDLKAAYAPKYEFILYGNKGRCYFRNGRKEDVLYFNKTGNKNHPTEKPVDLLEFLITNSSDEGDVVLDSFMGSGSTGIACVNTNRDFIGIELDEHYFQVAEQRIHEAQLKMRYDPYYDVHVKKVGDEC